MTNEITRTIALDWESYFDSECSVKVLGNRGYFSHPRFDAYLLSAVSDDGVRWVGHPKDFDWSLIDGAQVLSHHAAFDQSLYWFGVEQGWYPDVKYAAWDCTLDACSFHGVRRSLKNAVKDLFGVELSKETRDNMKDLDWATMTPEFKKEVEEYALADSDWCLKIWEKLAPTWPEFERRISRHTRQMCWRGIAVDEPRLRQAIEDLSVMRFELESEVPWTDTAKLKSRNAFDAECRKHGLTPPKSLAKSDPAAEAWFAEHEPGHTWMAAYRNVGRVNTLLLKLQSLERQTIDGVYYPYISYHNAHTGRFSSGGGTGVNCVPGDHDVLTRAGWVPIAEWDPSDEIAQWDDGKVSFVPATKVSRRAENEPLFIIDTPRVALRATAEHRVVFDDYLGRRGVRTISELAAQTGQPKIPTGGVIAGPDNPAWTDEMLRLMVATAADGSLPRGIAISFGFKKERKIIRLRELLAATGITYHSFVSASNGATHFYISRVNRPGWLTKGFGPWLLKLSERQLQVVVDELRVWDGSSHGVNGALMFHTSTESEAQWVATAAALLDRPVSVKAYRKSGDPKDAPARRWCVYFKEANSSAWLRRGQISETRFSGAVFCPQVPSGFFLVRHANRIHVTGNCQNLTKGEMFGVNMRELLVARPGKKLAIVDLSQIEVRTALWLAGAKKALEEIRKTDDLYHALAVAFDLWTDEQGPLRVGDPKLRQGTKIVGLGVLYGASAKKVAMIAKIPLEEAERWVWLVKTKFPEIPRLWAKLNTAITRARGCPTRRCELRLPSGRAIQYRNVRYEGDGIVCDILKGAGYMTVRPWAGLCCENISQATARDCFMDGALRVEDLGFPILFHVHDEIIAEVDEDTATGDLEAIIAAMSTSPEWCPDIPLSAEGSITDKYTK